MPKLRFRGAEVRSFTGKVEEGGIVYRLHLRSVLSKEIAEIMMWDVLDDRGFLREGLKSPKLKGVLRTDKITLEPNGLSKEEKEKHSLEWEIVEVGGFQATTSANDDSREVYLTFVAKSSGSFKPVETWLKKWGQAPCLAIVEGIRQADITEEEEEESETPETPAEEEKPKRKRGRKQEEMFTPEERAGMAPATVE